MSALFSPLALRTATLPNRLVLPAMVTTADFGANYFVIGELATAAGLSSLSLVAGPIAYFAHEAAWHYYGPASARHSDPLEATVHVPIPGAAEGEENGRTHFASVKVSRALAKTVTYEGVTAVSEFGVNYLFIRDLASAAGLAAFSIVISPFVYYVHEKAWDYYDAAKARQRRSLTEGEIDKLCADAHAEGMKAGEVRALEALEAAAREVTAAIDNALAKTSRYVEVIRAQSAGQTRRRGHGRAHVVQRGGFTGFRRAAETPFNLVFEAR